MFAQACARLTACTRYAGQGSLCEVQLALQWCPTQDWPRKAAHPACQPVTAPTRAPARGQCRSAEQLALHLQGGGRPQPCLLMLSSRATLVRVTAAQPAASTGLCWLHVSALELVLLAIRADCPA